MPSMVIYYYKKKRHPNKVMTLYILITKSQTQYNFFKPF